MINDTFSFKRFGKYFKYDIARIWRNHSKALLIMGLSVVILYAFSVLFSLIFKQEWSAPGIMGRTALFMAILFVVELYMTRLYGKITEKREGSDWILVPASKAEKFVSMLIIAIFLVPLVVFGLYLVSDWLICLIDKTAGESLMTHGIPALFSMIAESDNSVDLAQMGITSSFFIISSILGNCANFLYFLLCGIVFKKNKIVYAIAIVFGASTVLSILSSLALPFINFESLVGMESQEQIFKVFRGIMNGSMILTALLALGFGWGVWRRISTIKH